MASSCACAPAAAARSSAHAGPAAGPAFRFEVRLPVRLRAGAKAAPQGANNVGARSRQIHGRRWHAVALDAQRCRTAPGCNRRSARVAARPACANDCAAAAGAHACKKAVGAFFANYGGLISALHFRILSCLRQNLAFNRKIPFSVNGILKS
jgi:hypothetical protein